jgi:hypothetical protein
MYLLFAVVRLDLRSNNKRTGWKMCKLALQTMIGIIIPTNFLGVLQKKD